VTTPWVIWIPVVIGSASKTGAATIFVIYIFGV
jgi:hypothetical protein